MKQCLKIKRVFFFRDMWIKYYKKGEIYCHTKIIGGNN